MNKKEFWNERAKNEQYPGSNDFVAQRIEQNYIIDSIPKHAKRVIDIGCGDGNTLKKVCADTNRLGVGIDYADEMIRKAKSDGNSDRINFHNLSILESSVDELGLFDVAYTQRCLINLDSFEDQKNSLYKVGNLLVPNGIFIMVECTRDGLEQTNGLRKSLGLDEIAMPWHNNYFLIDDLKSIQNDNLFIERIDEVSSVYYFVSRVLYAKFATDKSEQPAYDSPFNLIAERLPQDISTCGPVKAFVWRKK